MAVRKGLTFYRIIVQKEAFLSMTRNALLSNTKWNMHEVLNSWWPVAFTTGMPENKTVGEVIIAISYKLVMKGYEKEEIIPPEGFISNYYAAIKFNGEDFDETTKCLNRCDTYNDYYTMTIDKLRKLFPINSTEEAGMAVKKSIKTSGGKKDTVSKAGNFLDGCKSPRLRLYIPKIMEQKMSDQEIVDFMHKEGFKEVDKGFISSARRNLNEGVYKWAPEVKTELEEIKEDKEPTRPKGKKDERVDEPSRPTAKKATVGNDSSLIPELDGKVLTIKDFTTIVPKKTATKKAVVKKTVKKTVAKKTVAKKTVAKKTKTKKFNSLNS